jgi:hypothetical protein
MACINRELKVMYIHLPKAGGLFIERVLRKFYGFETIKFGRNDHDEFNENKNLKKSQSFKIKDKMMLHLRNKGLIRYHECDECPVTKEEFETFYKFTIVRNPYDRIVSSFNYLKKTNMIDNNTTFDKHIFDEETVCDYSYFHSFISQYDHLVSSDNKININYIGKFENLNEELCAILKNIGISEIKHKEYLSENIIVNSSNQDKIPYTDYYNEESLQKINTYFKNDFETFGFKMCKNLDELIENSKNYIISDDTFIEKNKNLLNKIDNTVQLSNGINLNLVSNTNKITYLEETQKPKHNPNIQKQRERYKNIFLEMIQNLKPVKDEKTCIPVYSYT